MARKKLSFTSRYVLAFGLLMLLANTVLGVVILYQSTSTVRSLISKNMLDVVRSAADLLDGDTLAALTEEDVAAALTTREDLWERVAKVRAQEVKKSFSHVRPNGTSCFTAYDEAGFPESYEAENIAFGYKTEKDVVKAWLNSVDHRASIMSTLYNTVATSLYAKTNWAQNFYAELGK